MLPGLLLCQITNKKKILPLPHLVSSKNCRLCHNVRTTLNQESKWTESVCLFVYLFIYFWGGNALKHSGTCMEARG